MPEPDDNGSGGYVETTSSARPGTGPQRQLNMHGVDGPQVISAPFSLPSEHIDHAAVLTNEMNVRLAQFDAGIAALEGERNGQIEAYERDEAERKAKHVSAVADLDRRIDDLKKGRRMLTAALGEGERK